MTSGPETVPLVALIKHDFGTWLGGWAGAMLASFAILASAERDFHVAFVDPDQAQRCIKGIRGLEWKGGAWCSDPNLLDVWLLTGFFLLHGSVADVWWLILRRLPYEFTGRF